MRGYPFEILRDDTVACLLADYVIWVSRKGDDYRMSPQLRRLVEVEIVAIGSMMREKKDAT